MFGKKKAMVEEPATPVDAQSCEERRETADFQFVCGYTRTNIRPSRSASISDSRSVRLRRSRA